MRALPCTWRSVVCTRKANPTAETVGVYLSSMPIDSKSHPKLLHSWPLEHGNSLWADSYCGWVRQWTHVKAAQHVLRKGCKHPRWFQHLSIPVKALHIPTLPSCADSPVPTNDSRVFLGQTNKAISWFGSSGFSRGLRSTAPANPEDCTSLLSQSICLNKPCYVCFNAAFFLFAWKPNANEKSLQAKAQNYCKEKTHQVGELLIRQWKSPCQRRMPEESNLVLVCLIYTVGSKVWQHRMGMLGQKQYRNSDMTSRCHNTVLAWRNQAREL